MGGNVPVEEKMMLKYCVGDLKRDTYIIILN